MKIDVSEANGAVVIALADEIVSRDDQAVVTQAIATELDGGKTTFVLDLSDVPYVSSLGIAALVAAYVKVNRGGAKLRLVNPRPKVASILEMTKVADMFRTYTSVEEALGAE